jgi:predicted DsbA family dithiol-disulfide isomerase
MRRPSTNVAAPWHPRPTGLNSEWFDASLAGPYKAPNWIAEASRDFLDPNDERIRLALTRAAVLGGQKIGASAIAIATQSAAAAAHRNATELRTAAKSARVQARVAQSSANFLALQLSQRPLFVIQSDIGNKAVLSGIHRAAPIAAALKNILVDSARYAPPTAHHSPAPRA